MASSELYLLKQQFFLGAFKTVIQHPVSEGSPDYIPTVVYVARAHIALGSPGTVATIVPAASENVALKAVSALARYVAADEEDRDEVLEHLRDLCVELEGDDADGSEEDKGFARVSAGIAFARAGEVEEALETLGAGTKTENLEAVAVIVQIYLSIARADLAKAQFEQAKNWADDDLLLQIIESSIVLVTGRDGYSDAQSFYTEQLANPSLTSTHILTARGIARLLRGEISDAKSDLEEAMTQQGASVEPETLAAFVVACGLGQSKKAEAEEWWSRLVEQHPEHPLVVDVRSKAELFDGFVSHYDVPPLAVGA